MAKSSKKSGTARPAKKSPKGSRSGKPSKAKRSAAPAAVAAPASKCARDPRLPDVGGTIEKVYKGRTLVVKVTEAGLEFEGETYRSLSAIASKAMGGASVNGFLFFGL